MVRQLALVKESCGVYESSHYRCGKGIRRLPVVDDNGGLIGILTFDDVLMLLADELITWGKLVEHEQKNVAVSS